MCRSKSAVHVIEPKHSSSRISRTSTVKSPRTSTGTFSGDASTGIFNSSYKDSSKSSISSRTSLSSLRESLPENPHIYDFSDISKATSNFHSSKYSSSSTTASWRCLIHGKDVVVFQRKLRCQIDKSELRQRLSVICKSHHLSIVKLLGASISGSYIYLVYDYVRGASLKDCLKNRNNPNFTVLSKWIERIKFASDLAHGLDYIHHFNGLNQSYVHNHIKSSSIIVSEPKLSAKICHFGTAELCGEITDQRSQNSNSFNRSNSGKLKFEGTRGYMSPEFLSSGVATQKSDVYAFGVVVLELLSGEEPLKYQIDEETGAYTRVSVIETATAAIDGGDKAGDEVEKRGRVRRWIDQRLKDSFPVEVAEKMTRVGLECVNVDPNMRPDMGRVAGTISKLYLESTIWVERMAFPTDISLSLAPR